jgi:Cof subfamily protein (haloacid dehalogenase superfamily)
MSIKLLALDLDGTLVADLRTVPPRTQAAIKAAVRQGVKVAIATGREFAATKSFVNLLGLTTPTICYQGALIYDSQAGQTIASQGIPLSLAHHLIDLSRTHTIPLNLYANDTAYTEHVTPQSRAMYRNIGALQVEVRDLKQAISRDPIKGLIVHPAGEGERLVALLRNALGDSLRVVRSLPTHIELIAPGVSKGQALATLAAHYDISQHQVMAIGDQDNDIEMIEWAGLGIAMGNASPGAKAAADVIAPPLSEEGAIWAIERFILQA